jgi:hypothetical protein
MTPFALRALVSNMFAFIAFYGVGSFDGLTEQKNFYRLIFIFMGLFGLLAIYLATKIKG